MGGCISSDSSGNSKLELSDINSNIYRVVNVDDNGVALWSGQLGITRTELTLYRKGRDPTRWPLKCLRRYGYDADLFSFEAGRRCTTGEGIYAFRCRRAENLFQTMQNYIQLSTLSDDGNGALLMSGGIAGNEASSMVLNANSGSMTMPTNMSSNYILPNSRSANQTLRMSPSVYNDGPHRNFDTSDANYLEPIITASTTNRMLTRFHSIGDTSIGPLSPGGSIDPHSPGSPNSINNILEVTSLNPLPSSASSNNGVSNIYQEFPLRAESMNTRENNAKKLSLDIPPQEQAPPVNFTPSNSSVNALRVSSMVTTNAVGSNNTNSNAATTTCNESATPLSPTRSLSQQDSFDSVPMYMNVTPGEMSTSVSTPKLHGIINSIDGGIRSMTTTSTLNNNTITSNNNTTTTSTNNSNNNIKIGAFTADPNHCYENLEPSEVRPMLLQQQRAQQQQQQQQRRLSKTDIMSRLEQVAASSPPATCNEKTSEPSTPTHRKVNYIVLDLDQTYGQNNSITSNISSTTSSNAVSGDAQPGSTNGSVHTSPSRNSIQLTSSSSTNVNQSSTNSNPLLNSVSVQQSLLPPESPKKGIFDYATIDFNKTVALSNSTAPSMDCEGSRKTRHSSTIVPSISGAIGLASGGTGAPSSHSNSISD